MAAYKAKSPNNKVPLILFGRSDQLQHLHPGSLFGSVLAERDQLPWPPPGPGDVGAPDQEPGSLQYSLEKILEKDPDVLLVETQGGGSANASQQLAANPIWSQLKAVKNNQVYEVRFDLYVAGRGTALAGPGAGRRDAQNLPGRFPNPLP